MKLFMAFDATAAISKIRLVARGLFAVIHAVVVALDPMVLKMLATHGQGPDRQMGTLHLHTALLGAHP